MLDVVQKLRTAENRTQAIDAFRTMFRPDDKDPKKKPTSNKPKQTITFTYNNYSDIFATEPVQLDSRVAGQPLSIEQTTRGLSEDFFRRLEESRYRGRHDLHINLVFPVEKRNKEVENEIRGLYKQNYEDDLAVASGIIKEYKQRSRFFFSLAGLGVAATASLLFIGVPKQMDLSESYAENISRYSQDFMVEGVPVLLFLAAFAGWHLRKDKPEELEREMELKERYLNAKITIITGDEMRRTSKVTSPPAQEQSTQSS